MSMQTHEKAKDIAWETGGTFAGVSDGAEPIFSDCLSRTHQTPAVDAHMNATPTRTRYHLIGLGILTMAVLVTLVLLWWGFSPLAAAVVAMVLSCVFVALCAWRLQQRALRSVNDAIRNATGHGHGEGSQGDKCKGS